MIDLKQLDKQTMEKCIESGAAVSMTRLSLPVPDFDRGKNWAWYFLYNADSEQLYRPFARLVVALDSGEIAGIVPIARMPDEPLAPSHFTPVSDDQRQKFDQLFSKTVQTCAVDLKQPISCHPVAEFLNLLETMVTSELLPWYFAQNPVFFYWCHAIRACQSLGISHLHRLAQVAAEPQATLSQSDLIFLAAIYRSPTLLDAQNLYYSDQVSQQIQASAKTYLANGWIRFENEAVAHIVPELAHIVQVYASPQVALFATYWDEQGIRENRYLFDGTTWVRDSFSDDEQHHLSIIDHAEISKYLQSINLMHESSAIGKPCWLPHTAIQEIKDLAMKKGEAAAHQKLSRSIGDQVTAASLLSAFLHPIQSFSLVRFAFQGRRLERLRGGNLTRGAQGTWLLAPFVDEAGQETERVLATPANPAETQTWLQSVVTLAIA